MAEPKKPDAPKEPAAQTEEEMMTQHMDDLEAWLMERKLMIVPQISNEVVPVGAFGQGAQLSALWRLIRSR